MHVVFKFMTVQYNAVELTEEQLAALAADGYAVEAMTNNRDGALVPLKRHVAE